VLPQRVVGTEQPAQGSGHSPGTDAQGHRSQTLGLGGAVQSQELGSVILVGPFLLRMFFGCRL